MPEKLDVVGISEIAERAGVSKQTVANWRTRNPDFPAPLAELKSGPIWRLQDIVAWSEQRGLPLKEPAGAQLHESGENTMTKTVGSRQ